MTENTQPGKNSIEEEQPSKPAQSHSLAFIREVVKYFMDFLETDFHKRRNPKRSIKFRSDNNLLIGIDLGKYTKFKKLVYGAINHKNSKSGANRAADR